MLPGIGHNRQVYQNQVRSAYNTVPVSDDNGWTGRTLRIIIPASALLVPSGTPTSTRIRFFAGSAEPCEIESCYIGHKSGTYNYTTTPVALLFGGSVLVFVPVGGSSWSDSCNFVWDKVSDIVVAVRFNGGSSNDKLKYASVGGRQDYWIAGLDTATVSTSGYTNATAGITNLVGEIEMDGF